ncbi:ABC transporter substrate-binding protein [Nocardioides sp. L-11A]|uniref:ABC transporter substrate-binding protein n=1 Tax=Nocardioides sp. L-11A TaxID=3043848 RepID=UPI002499AE7D|nr:ABC transporter substrate-binding protein [Nocardioides sp. L-11A]
MFTKRHRLAATAGIGLLAVAAAGCGGSSSSSEDGDLTTLSIAWADSPSPLNPAVTSSANTANIVANIFDRLVWLTPDFEVTPWLATEWEVAPDGLSYTFTLREDVTFHDGTPFNADAVVQNIDYITDPATKSTAAIQQLGTCTTATAESEFVLRLSCDEPYVPLLASLSSPYLGIQSPAAIAEHGAAMSTEMAGTGPYELESATADESVVLKAYDKYDWAPEAAGFGEKGPERIEFKTAPNPQARVAALQAGQVQAAQRIPGALFKSLRSGYDVVERDSPGLGFFSSINTSLFPTDDVAVRQAILYTVDRQAVVDLAESGAFEPSNTVLQPGTFGYDESLESQFPHDPDKAAELLEGAGWTRDGDAWTKDGKPLTLTIGTFSDVPQYVNIAEAIQAQLRDGGIAAEIELQGRAAYLEAGDEGRNNLTPSSFAALDPVLLDQWFVSGAFFNWSKVADEQLDTLLEDAAATSDLEERKSLYLDAQKRILDLGLLLPVRPDQDLILMDKGVDGLVISGGGYLHFAGVS